MELAHCSGQRREININFLYSFLPFLETMGNLGSFSRGNESWWWGKLVFSAPQRLRWDCERAEREEKREGRGERGEGGRENNEMGRIMLFEGIYQR
jgi:hypothetical protein